MVDSTAGNDPKRTLDNLGEESLSQANSAQRERSNRLRAGLITPLVVTLLVFAIVFIRDGDSDDVLGLLNWWLPVSIGIAYLVFLSGFVVFGLPAIAFLGRIGRLRIWTLMIAGAVQGALLGYFLFLLFGGVGPGHTTIEPDIYRELPNIAMLSVFGMLYAAIYGIVAKIRIW